MQIWIIQTLNSLALGGLLFMLSSGFALIFGLMRIANLTHGSLFMLGTYVAATLVRDGHNLIVAALVAMITIAIVGGLIERFILRRLSGNSQGQVLATLGLSFVAADFCLMVWGGDPIPISTPPMFQTPLQFLGLTFPTYRLVVLVVAIIAALLLYLLMERTRLGAMIRAGVDDMAMARAVGIPASALFTTVFCLGSALAGLGGTLGGPIFNAYPGLDGDMAVGFRGQRQHDLGRIDIGVDIRTAMRHAFVANLVVQLAQQLHFMLRVPVDTLPAIAQLVQ